MSPLSSTVELGQVQQGAPGQAQRPAQPNAGAPATPANPRDDAEQRGYRGPGCRYQEKDDLKLLV